MKIPLVIMIVSIWAATGMAQDHDSVGHRSADFFELGLSAGTPAGLNVELGYLTPTLGVSVGGGYSDGWNGLEGRLLWNLHFDPTTTIYLAAIGGWRGFDEVAYLVERDPTVSGQDLRDFTA